MKVSRPWLQRFFDAPLPETEELGKAFTFHSFELDEAEGDLLDLKVLADRAAYGMSHRGAAYELSAALDIPMKSDPLRESIPKWNETDELEIKINRRYVVRHTGALVRGVKVGPSPAWLREFLESVGQKSINNIVDASNFVMLNIGQPTHAFDAGKLATDNGILKIDIREAKKGEKLTILTGEELTLDQNMFVFSDAATGEALDVAGIKGGLRSGITEETTDLFLSAGNYDGLLVRQTTRALRLVTDASQRFQNKPSPELTAFGMRDLIALIQEVAGGELVGVIDIYPDKQKPKEASVSVSEVKEILGPNFGAKQIEDAFRRLAYTYGKKGETYTVQVPFERTDLTIPEDLAEEVGRITGYEHVLPVNLPKSETRYEFDKTFYWTEKVRTFLVNQGFSEVFTSVFTDEKGEVEVLNKVESDTPYLRQSLIPPLERALKMNTLNAPMLGLRDVRLFEIGTVFKKEGEELHLATAASLGREKAEEMISLMFYEFGGLVPIEAKNGVVEINLGELITHFPVPGAYEQLPESATERYAPFSRYPFAYRDIAVWTPEGTSVQDVEKLIKVHAGELLARTDLFDEFSKDARTSYAFRLVFQAYDRTLSDEEVNGFMQAVTDAMGKRDGWQVR
jgi:phenylalanyl-tRNA synthetase beta chain